MQRKARLTALAVFVGLALGIGAGAVALATAEKSGPITQRGEAASAHLHIARVVLA